MRDQILVLNFEDTYAAGIATKLRAEKIACKVLPGNIAAEHVLTHQALGLILAGGITGQIPDQLDGRLLRSGIPVLALGDTAAPVCSLLGGQYGDALVLDEVNTMVFAPSRITQGLENSERMFSSVRPLTLTPDLEQIAAVEGHILGFTHKTLEIYALDCQLEPNDSDLMNILLQFSMDVCGATQWWSEDSFISQARADIIEAAGDDPAVCVISGGLDSGVTALLAHRALGERLTCIFIDTGLLRENEAMETAGYYRKAGLNLMKVDASQRFLEALKGLSSYQDKRRAIMDTLEKELNQVTQNLHFGLLIDSASAQVRTNASAQRFTLPRLSRERKRIAPLNDLYKEEIRHVGEALGMPEEIIRVQPFPWTGLGLRIMGECTPQKVELLRRADALFRDLIKEAGLHKRLWKFFALLSQVPHQQNSDTVVIALRAVTSSLQGNEVLALPARLPYDLLERYTQLILPNYPQVAKIVYDLTPGSTLRDSDWYLV